MINDFIFINSGTRCRLIGGFFVILNRTRALVKWLFGPGSLYPTNWIADTRDDLEKPKQHSGFPGRKIYRKFVQNVVEYQEVNLINTNVKEMVRIQIIDSSR